MLSLLLLNTSKTTYRLVSRRANTLSLYSSLAKLSARGFSAASQYDDEDSMPENVRDDRTLNIAKNQPNIKSDFLLNELLNKEHNLATLEAFYNGN
jgi:hypothetical protein